MRNAERSLIISGRYVRPASTARTVESDINTISAISEGTPPKSRGVHNPLLAITREQRFSL
jgi:hypothetical protein